METYSHNIATPAPYVGGKRLLAKTIVPFLQNIPHKLYAEPFVGMGGVFLRKSSKHVKDVINDINGDIYTLFRVLREHAPLLAEYMLTMPACRQEYERQISENPDTLTDIQRAARFLYLQRLSYGGRSANRTFGTDTRERLSLKNINKRLEYIQERMQGVTVEHLDWPYFIERYDRRDTLFYIDPPYWGCESYYGKGLFTREDFTRLAEVLAALKGRFVMSLNDTPGVRDTFNHSTFVLREVGTVYSLGHSGAQAHELLISNTE